MIRRNITLEDDSPAWLLISQVEHAHLSGELTRQWNQPFSPEIIFAITHHDDGWRDWERTLHVDPVRGCPLSFLEISIDTAVQIWSRSIESVHRYGPLGAAIVAGHFIGLAGGSEHATQPTVAEWIDAMSLRRAAWLAAWKRESAANTTEIADHGQRMLLTADLLSLWLCCDGPVSSVDTGDTPNAEMTTRTSAILGTYQFESHSKSVGRDNIIWHGSLTPWPFAEDGLNLTTAAIAAPTRKYCSWSELLAAGRQMELRWQLRQTLPTTTKC